jgi:hypothetical protein
MNQNNTPKNYYICNNCQTANVFQPWALGKERFVKCPHCRQLNKLRYGSNPKQALVALFIMGCVMLLIWLIWAWLSNVSNAWLF